MSRPAPEARLSRAQRRRLDRRERARIGPRSRRAALLPVWRSPTAVVSALAIVVAVVLIVVLGQNRRASTSDLTVPTSSYPPTLIGGETLGRADAPITLDIWSDFQCPFCGQLARTYLQRLVSDFVAGGTLRIVSHDVAFVGSGTQNESIEAAVAASCAAEQGRYWQFHDFLFWNQHGENQGAFHEARLTAMADALGLDRQAWDSCRAGPEGARTVSATTSEAISAGINSTPTLILNGVTSAGLPRTYDDLANAIRALLPASPAAAASPSATASTAR